MLLTTSPATEGEVTTVTVPFFDAEDAENYTTAEPVAADPPPAKVELTEEDQAERLFWDKCETLGKIKDCARMIQEVEGEIDGYQDQIKEAKEVLKGQQALLARYSTQLADILDGHPLPKNPAAPAGQAADAEDPTSGGSWRDTPTAKLLEGLKGLGAKKLEAIIEVAPTAGKLEALRGEASMACKPFKDVLPKGCGETLADEIENRLVDHVAKFLGTDGGGDDEADD
jgi:hypothetical protein